MRVVFLRLPVLLLLALSACMRPEMEKTIAYREADHARYMAKGDASIKGEGFIRRPDGRLARCSGGNVFLFPDTPYFREAVDMLRKGGRPAKTPELEEAQNKNVRRTQCDQHGRFAFEDLPQAKWFMMTRVSYESPNDSWSNDSLFLTEAETRAGEVTKIILSDPNRI